MISLTLAQARRLLAYSAVLYFLPVLFTAWFPNKYTFGGALVGAFLLYVWRDNFTQRVVETEVHAQYADDDPTHVVTSALSEMQIGFHGSVHDDDD